MLANGTAEEFNYGATKKFLHIPKNKRKTFTCDNGSEFAEHIELSQILELETYIYFFRKVSDFILKFGKKRFTFYVKHDKILSSY